MLVSMRSLTIGGTIARPRQYTDEEILDATEEMVLKHGPSVSTSVIANHLGLSKAALFKRFSNKDRLIVSALFRPQLMARSPVAALLKNGPTQAPIRDQLIEIGVGILTSMRRLVPCMTMFHAAGIDPRESMGHDLAPPVQGRKLLTAWLQRAHVQDRIRTMDPAILAVGFLGMLKARPFREVILGDTDLDCSDTTYVTQLVDQMLSGIAGPSA